MKTNKLKRKKILNFFKKIKIKIKSLCIWKIIILISLLLIIFSIFTPWFSTNNSNIWIFSNIFWLTWYITIALILINLFFIFSNNLKEKIKLYLSNKMFNNNYIFIISAIIFIILWLNSYFIITNWIYIFTNDITIYIGITFYLIAIIFYSFWTYLKLKSKNKNTHFISINESQEKTSQKNNKNDKNVMKLPFQ